MGKKNPFNPTAAPAGGRAESPFAAPEPGPASPPNTAPASERQEIEPVPSSVWAIAGILVLLLLLGLGGYSLYQQKRATAGLLDQLRARDASPARDTPSDHRASRMSGLKNAREHSRPV